MLWREESEAVFSQTIAAAAKRLNISELAVAKDYWVCEALRAVINQAPGDLVFKGGTSLEKMRLVQRFSEDLDLLVTRQYDTKRATERALKEMCRAAADAIPGAVQVKPEPGSGGNNAKDGRGSTFWRTVYIELPLPSAIETSGIADPRRLMLELGQSGGPMPSSERPVTSLLARELADADVAVDQYVDLVSFSVRMLHPGRTLIEKLLRMNNFSVRVADDIDTTDGFTRIGRQFYDVWALLGNAEVRELLADVQQTTEIVESCIEVSQDFPNNSDQRPPVGGFAESVIFSGDWIHTSVLRREHEKAMEDLFYGEDPPSFDDVIERVREHRGLLNFVDR
ncbi:nucleotidyl transferase AbiEii/AbiGii toxin family protein [Rhodococcus sp. D-46]|nr:nucleotidyl transferase AbiEii/AbiGii toxin family protein [Rhodococcus sp. D-46]